MLTLASYLLDTLVKKTLVTLAFIIWLSSSAIGKEMYDVSTLTPNEAYEYGELLRVQLKNNAALEYLKFAADAGHANASYVYASELKRKRSSHQEDDSYQQYMMLAASNGSLAAKRYLYTRADWLSIAEKAKLRDEYHDQLIELGATEPSFAYFRLSQYYYQDNDELSDYYLEKAQQFDVAKAFMEEGERIKSGHKSFIFQAKGERAMLRQYVKAAELGYIPAIRRIVTIFESESDFKQALVWREKALENGDLTSLISLSRIYRGESDQYSFVGIDLVRSKAYLEVFLQSAGRDLLPSLYSQAEDDFSKLTKLTDKEQAKESDYIRSSLLSKKDFIRYDEVLDSVQY
ncbi:hypothetical protein VIOR3934_11082 [Vibrio orientalis CIP 102891 = ATCC 33934]|uniref:Sel1 repeat family protein n=1 Tax=Vibrio orientalis CIP 102891 = ATCC 33934 TaxID=675816 RepID=C9QIY5_VIBOR|nr:hypothetical protein [Vibrio orientalis]EEX91790.1 hypothetical protein VIA_002432 [Vibrio orientalis CIP 102891 = ATCC 33934]EGU51011.1 hypothetical protein VIOR3934_11082 [Vibrio orientalis CIP 102891 = ATCC 33934]